MKNYYKILGIKKNASEEEIRERWVKLMRKLHPDKRAEGKVGDEKVKEINEAYQVLKHSSTRIGYDLKIAYDRKKRRSYVRKLSFPISILAVLLIIGAVYIKNLTNQKNSINPTNAFKVPDVLNNPNVPKDPNVLNDPNDLNGINEPNVPNNRHIPTSTHSSIDSSPPLHINASTRQPIDVPTRKPRTPTTPLTQQPDDPTDSKLQLVRRNDAVTQINQIDQINASSVPDVINDPNVPNKINVLNVPNELNETNDINELNVPNDRHITASTHPRMTASTRLIATEEEVKQFLANYIDRYTKKDLDGFVSLFSSRAVQNHRDRKDAIRTIYNNFFNQSQKIQYYMHDIKAEIYQNGAEIKARYELVHTLRKIGEKKLWRGDIRWTLTKENGVLKILSLDYQHQKSP